MLAVHTNRRSYGLTMSAEPDARSDRASAQTHSATVPTHTVQMLLCGLAPPAEAAAAAVNHSNGIPHFGLI